MSAFDFPLWCSPELLNNFLKVWALAQCEAYLFNYQFAFWVKNCGLSIWVSIDETTLIVGGLPRKDIGFGCHHIISL